VTALRLAHARQPVGRLLTCIRCADLVDVIEAPSPFIDPHLYICGNCLTPAAHQLELDSSRTETRRYDPDIAAFPEGY
jgi:hypothetical protein